MKSNPFTSAFEYIRMAWVAIRSNKLRSFLTTLGILMGVSTIIAIWTTIEGLNSYVDKQLSGIGASVVYVSKYPWVPTEEMWTYRNRKKITWKEYKAIRDQSQLADYISPQVVAMKTTSNREISYDNIPILGTTEGYAHTTALSLGEGRFLTELDIRSKSQVVVLGAELAGNLFKDGSALGKKIKIDDLRYMVIGVLERQGSFFGQSQDNYAIVPIGTFRKSFGQHRGLQIAVLSENALYFEDMKEELRGILRKERKVKLGKEDDFALNQQDQLMDFYDGLTSTLYAIITVIGIISLVVGGIGITNIMLVSVTERTREIGLRKAVGARYYNILIQFLIEAVTIAAMGGVIGIVIGTGIGMIVLSAMQVDIGISLGSVLVGVGFSGFVGVAAGFYPAYKAAIMNPIDALRYE